MEKEDFKKMDKKKKAEYINENLSEGMSFRDIYDITMNNNELAKSKETLLNQFRKAGYRINNSDKDNKISDRQIAATEFKGEYNQSDIKKNAHFEKVLESSEDIIQMLEWWKSTNNKLGVVDNRLNIQVPGGEDIRKTLRINNSVWNVWKEFCSRQPGFSEKDLLAKALLFYMNKSD